MPRVAEYFRAPSGAAIAATDGEPRGMPAGTVAYPGSASSRIRLGVDSAKMLLAHVRIRHRVALAYPSKRYSLIGYVAKLLGSR